ncbi:hypothetical protein LIER_40049 [Lithospermum erythrorhizon]|uniref:Uncharacterized protein n=1 Tax=Lithospermum erythrorhizon TaxID=34254 RepID=A0AAV3QNU9_LITER
MNAHIGGDEARPTIIETSNDPMMVEDVTPSVRNTAMEDAESMDVPTTDRNNDVTPTVVNTVAGVAGLLEERIEPTVVEGVADTLDANIEKKRSKEERVAKRAARKARKATKKAVEDEVQEVEKEQVPPAVQPIVSDEWLPEHEQQGDNVEEAYQGSEEEDVVDVIIKRRKAKSNLKINENRSRVGNKRISKNVVVVSIENVALNSKEEEAKWKFVASRRITDERILSKVTKKNADIMDILKDA